jgi:hypothetical protein
MKRPIIESIRCLWLFSIAAGCLYPGVVIHEARAEPAPLSLPLSDLVGADLIAEVREWTSAPVIREALRSRNKASDQLAQDQIDTLDKQWRAETQSNDQPLITSVLANPLSTYLYRIQARSVGLFTEVFVMDSKGLNVGQSSVTTDYWQGDEAKFQKTYGVGTGAVFLDEPEYHEGTATWRAQLNMTIDDSDGNAAGAITVELNLTELERRVLAGLTS